MSLKANDNLTPDVRSLGLQMSDMYSALNGVDGIYAQISSLQYNVLALQNTTITLPASPVANLLWNGEIGHSAHTWHDLTNPTPQANKNEEAAWWYSHTVPPTPQTFTTITTNDQIPLSLHNFTTGCAVDFITTTTLPTGLSLATTYFVIVITPSIVSVATTIANAFAGTATAITAGTGTGTHTIQQQLIETYTTAVAGSSTNNELKTDAHTTYLPQFSRWNSENGWGELTGVSTIDALLPANFVDATTPLARVSMIAARVNSFIEIPATAVMTAGIWDNTSGERIFLSGDIGLAANFVGTPDPGGVERRFKVLLTSDRGYQLLSDEVILYNTPTALDSTDYIAISWGQQSGQLQVDVYEHYDPGTTNEYRLLTQISAATSFIYEGGFDAVVPGYPTPTGTERNATFSTQELDMSDLAINAVAAAWDTVNFPIDVPANYNKANTTNRQWLRIWFNIAPNLYIEDVITDGTATITFPDGAIHSDTFVNGGYATSLPATAPYTSGAAAQSLYVDLVVQVYDEDDVLLATTSLDTLISDTSVTLAQTITTGSNRKIRIIGAGFHGILIDKIHLGYQQNTSYAPNAIDVRVLQPLAAPTSSSQGTVGTGGTGGGINCVAKHTPIKMMGGKWNPIQITRPGLLLAAAGLRPNTLMKLKPGSSQVRRVRTANGVEIICTDTERFITDALDGPGVQLARMRVGDSVMTEIDDRLVASRIVEISAYLGVQMVYTPTLSDNNLFIAGEIKLSQWKQWIRKILGRRDVKGGFVLHNSKSEEVA